MSFQPWARCSQSSICSLRSAVCAVSECRDGTGTEAADACTRVSSLQRIRQAQHFIAGRHRAWAAGLGVFGLLSDSAARREGLVRVRRADALDGVDIVLIYMKHGSTIHGMRYILGTCAHVPLQSV
jgi:hypothetical protein